MYAIPTLSNDLAIVDEKFNTVHTWQGHTGRITSVIRLMDDRVASAGSDQLVFIWPDQVFHIGPGIQALYQLMPEFLVIVRDKSICQLELSTGLREHFNVKGVNSIITTKKLQNGTIVLGCNEGSIRQFDGNEVTEIHHPCDDIVRCMIQIQNVLYFANGAIISNDHGWQEWCEKNITHLARFNNDVVIGQSKSFTVNGTTVKFESAIQCMKTLSNNHIALVMAREDGEPGSVVYTFDPSMNRTITQVYLEDDLYVDDCLFELHDHLLVVTARGLFLGKFANVREPRPDFVCVFDGGYDFFRL